MPIIIQKNYLKYHAFSLGLIFNVFTIFLLSGCTTPSIIATQAIQQGDFYNNRHQYKEAIVQYEKYLASSPQLGVYRNMPMEADVCRKLAYAYSTQGNYQKSLNYLNRALGIDSTQTNSRLEVIEDYRQIGITYGYLGEYESALQNLNRSLVMNKGMERSLKDVNRLSIADTYMSLAQIHLTMGDYRESQDFVNQALDIYNQVPTEVLGRIEANLALGIILRETGHVEQAMDHLNESLSLAEKNDYGKSRQWQAMGEVYRLKGDYNNYLTYMLKALDEAERTNINAQVIWANVRVGDAYEKLGDRDKARYYYMKSLQLQSGTENDTTGMLPSINMRLGDVQQSRASFMRSGSKIGTAIAGYQLGQLKLNAGEPDSAMIYLNKARNIFNDIGVVEGVYVVDAARAQCMSMLSDPAGAGNLFYTTLNKTVQPDLKWQIWFGLGGVFKQKENYDSAYLSYNESIKIIESIRGNLSMEELRSSYFNDKIRVYDRMIMLVLEHAGDIREINPEDATEIAFEFNERARSRSFLDMLGNTSIAPKKSGDASLVNAEQSMKLKIEKINQELQRAGLKQQDASDLRHELRQTETDYNNTLQKLALLNNDYRSVVSVKPPALKQVMADLDPQTCILEYWVSTDNLVTWVISRDKVISKIIPVSKDEITREVTAARRVISLKVDDLTQQTLEKLSDNLISPVSSLIKDFKNLVIVSHRSLHFLPFQALYFNGKYLVEKFNIINSPSSGVYHLCKNKSLPGGNSFLGMALGNYKIGSFSTLPGTQSEVDYISQVYQNMDKRTGSDISESYFKQQAEKYDYLHLATHGYFNKNQAMYSYILLSPDKANDGELTVREIFNLNLNADLVTLSACETGLGEISEGDELVGLSRAFIYAGTPAIIVSLWTVDDVTTSILMTRFYQYLNSGLAAEDALSQAQRDLLNENFTASAGRGLRSVKWNADVQNRLQKYSDTQSKNPYYWAPFILIGNGNIK